MYRFLWLIVDIDIHIAVECAVTAQVIHGENIFILDSRTSAFSNSLLTVENICELDPDQDVNFVPCHLRRNKTRYWNFWHCFRTLATLETFQP